MQTRCTINSEYLGLKGVRNLAIDTHFLFLRAGQGTHRRLRKCIPNNAFRIVHRHEYQAEKRAWGMKQSCHSHFGRLCYYADMMQSLCGKHLLALRLTSIPPSFFLKFNHPLSCLHSQGRTSRIGICVCWNKPLLSISQDLLPTFEPTLHAR